MDSIFKHMAAKPHKAPQVFEDVKNSFINSGEAALKALESNPHFREGDRYGWLAVKLDTETMAIMFKIRPGYGRNNQFVAHRDGLAQPHEFLWVEGDKPDDAIDAVKTFQTMATDGAFDDGLRAIFERNKAMVEARREPLANNHVSSGTVLAA